MIGILLNVVHFQVHKNITKESDGFHNHSTQLTMIGWSKNTIQYNISVPANNKKDDLIVLLK